MSSGGIDTKGWFGSIRITLCGVGLLLGLGASSLDLSANRVPIASGQLLSLRGPEAAIGDPPELPVPKTLLSPIAPSTVLDVALVLAPQSAETLDDLASKVSTPGSPYYHRYLSPKDFSLRFGAPQSVISSIVKTLGYGEVHDAKISASHLLVSFRARASVVERLFSTQIARYRSTSGARRYINLTAPRFPKILAPDIVGVVGLSYSGPLTADLTTSTTRPSIVATHVADSSQALASSGPKPLCHGASESGVTTADIADAYDFDPLYSAGDFGAGTTIALIEFAPFITSDITSFERCYGLSATSDPASPHIKVIPVAQASPARARTSGKTVGAEVETELDLETVIGLAPSTSIDVYEAANPNSNADALLAYASAIDNPAVNVISTSWGDCEPQLGTAQIAAEAALFRQAAIEGKTVIAASGDAGSSDCFGAIKGPQSRALSVDDPSSDPYVTGVGGTTINSLGPPPQEQAWNEGRSGAGGGGVSAIWAMPSYQSDAATTLGVDNPESSCPSRLTSCREVPDVSADAGTPLAIYCTEGGSEGCTSGWTGVGGTSLAAPIWAALVGLTDSNMACAGKPIGFADPALYAIASSSEYATAFNDVTTGENSIGFTHGLYRAQTGYDLATGLGTPIAGDGIGVGLVADLCSATHASSFQPASSLPFVRRSSPRSGRSTGGRIVTITGSGFDGATGVFFGTQPARSFRVLSDGSIRAIAPKGSGRVFVRVSNIVGFSWRVKPARFAYLPRPRVIDVSQDLDTVRPGDVVVITGVGFVGVTAVVFGDNPARFKVLSPTSIRAVVPSGHGSVDVTVVAPGGTSAAVPTDRVTYR